MTLAGSPLHPEEEASGAECQRKGYDLMCIVADRGEMAKKIRQRSRKSQIITPIVAGGILLILHLALVALLALGYIEGYTFGTVVVEFFLLFLDLPFAILLLVFLRDDLRRWRRSRKEAAQSFAVKRL